MSGPLYLGIDIGGTKSAVVAGTRSGAVAARAEWASEAARGPGPMLERIVAEGRALLRDHPVAGAGVSIGGPLDSRAGVIHSPPNLPGWDALPLKEILERELQLPVRVEHDAAACAYAEYLWGAGRGTENLAYLTCGTGFGAGFVFHGRIHAGARGASCEVGHISLRPDGPAAFGKQGSAEAWCAGTALTTLAAWRFPERWAAAPPSGREIGALFAAGDAGAAEVVRLNAGAVGEVAALLADSLGLDAVLLGSLARYLGAPWIAQVRAAFDLRVLPAIGRGCRVEAAALGERLQDLSALAAALGGEGR